jgi:hypothetical protein
MINIIIISVIIIIIIVIIIIIILIIIVIIILIIIIINNNNNMTNLSKVCKGTIRSANPSDLRPGLSSASSGIGYIYKHIYIFIYVLD